MKILSRLAKLCIGCYILILAFILVIVPNLPLIALLMACKYVEAYGYFYLYGAEVILDYDFFKLSTGPDKNLRTTLVIINKHLELRDVKELVVTSLIDAHTVDGELCFPQLTKRHVAGIFNNYWVDEERFSLSDHINMWGDGGVFTDTELQQILVRLKDDNQNIAISPWLLTVIPLHLGKTAVVLRCHPALRDLDLVRTLLEEHKICHHEISEHNLFSNGVIHLFEHLCLSSWNLAEYILNSLKSKRTSRDMGPTNIRKVLAWSNPINVKVFEETAKHLKVDVTTVLLGCVSYIVNDLDLLNYECPLSISDICNKNISSNAYPIKSGNDDPVSAVIKSKEKLNELSCSGKLFTSVLCERIANLILPIRFAKYVARRFSNEMKVNITSLLADEADASLLSFPVDLISVWCEESKESSIDICVTNTMGQLVIATDAYHTLEATSTQIFQQFDNVVKKLAVETGVFPNYFQ